MSMTARPLTYNAYHNPVSYEEPGHPLGLPGASGAGSSTQGGVGANELGITGGTGHHTNHHLYPEQVQPPFPALHLFSLNNTFAPKHILLGPPTVTPTSRLKVGRQTSQKTAPHPSNAYFDSKVLSRTHAELWSEHGKIYIRDLRSSNGTFINGHRLSPEGCESEPSEIRNEDLLEFGIDIIAEDGQQILHHKVAARAFTILDAHAADRAQHDWTNLYRVATLGTSMAHDGPGGGAGSNGAGAGSGANSSVGVGPGGSSMGPQAEGGLRRGKGGKSFDHVIAQLQAEMSRLNAGGGGSPDAVAARAAAAAARHRERAQKARSPSGHDDAQGTDGASLQPLDETAQRLSLLLSSLSTTRSQLDALRAASLKADEALRGDETKEGDQAEGDVPTVTPSTPVTEQDEDDVNSSTLKKSASSAEALRINTKDTADSEPSPSLAAPVPQAAIVAAARLPALRGSLTQLRGSVREVRASLLVTLRERELREADEQLAGTSMRSLGRNSGSGPSGGIGGEPGKRGTSASTMNKAGDYIQLMGVRSSGGDPEKGAMRSADNVATTSSGLSLGSTSQGSDALGSPPREPLPSLPDESSLDPSGPRSRALSNSTGAGGAQAAKRQHMAVQLRMSSARPGGGAGPSSPDAPTPNSSDATLPGPSGGAGGGHSRKRSADEHFETEDAEAAQEAEALTGSSSSSATRDVDGGIEGPSVGAQGSTSAASPTQQQANGENADRADGQPRADEVSTANTTARLDRAEASLTQLKALLSRVQQARQSQQTSSTSIERSSQRDTKTPIPTAEELDARLNRLEQSLVLRRLDVKPADSESDHGESLSAELDGLAALRRRWLGPDGSKATQVWDGLQTKFAAGSGMGEGGAMPAAVDIKS